MNDSYKSQSLICAHYQSSYSGVKRYFQGCRASGQNRANTSFPAKQFAVEDEVYCLDGISLAFWCSSNEMNNTLLYKVTPDYGGLLQSVGADAFLDFGNLLDLKLILLGY